MRLLPLPLNLVQEIKVRLVEVVHTHVTVLTTRAVAGALGVDSHVVERTEMATHTTNLLFENLVVETGLKLALASRRGCNIHGSLTTTEDHVVLDRRDGRAVERCVGNIGVQNLEIIRGNKLKRARVSNLDFSTEQIDTDLGVLVLGSGNEVGPVGSPLQIRNLHIRLVGLDHVQQLAALPAKLASHAKSALSGCLLTFASYCETVPSSWPEIMYLAP